MRRLRPFLILFSFFLGLEASSLENFTFHDIAGVYKMTSTDIPFQSLAKYEAIDESSGRLLSHVRKSPYGKMKCRASLKIEGTLVSGPVECQSGVVYDYEVNFESVVNTNQFTVPVKHTLYGEEAINMKFVRLR